MKSWSGVRWIIVSPAQQFEQTLSRQRKGAWEMFKFAVLKDIEGCKKRGFRAIKVHASFKAKT